MKSEFTFSGLINRRRQLDSQSLSASLKNRLNPRRILLSPSLFLSLSLSRCGMASVADTWTPRSLQLHFALGGANCRRLSPVIVVRTRLGKPERRIRVLCVAHNGNGAQGRRNFGSWAGSSNEADSLSGWSGSGNEQESEPEPAELQKKKLSRGTKGDILFSFLL